MRLASFDVGIKNLAFCIFERTESSLCIKEWIVCDITCKSNEDMCKQVVITLDKYPGLLQVDTVVIEKQPSKNNKMRIIEALINSYFVIKGVMSDSSTVNRSIVYSSKHKLGNIAGTLRGKSNYRERKKLGVARCARYIVATNQPCEFVSLFNASKKQDDLADSLLQGLSFVSDPILADIEKEHLSPPTRIVSRKPSLKQTRSGYSKSNIKYLLAESKTEQQAVDIIGSNDKLKKAITNWYPNRDLQCVCNDMHLAWKVAVPTPDGH